jgi:hypothetical protein
MESLDDHCLPDVCSHLHPGPLSLVKVILGSIPEITTSTLLAVMREGKAPENILSDEGRQGLKHNRLTNLPRTRLHPLTEAPAMTPEASLTHHKH